MSRLVRSVTRFGYQKLAKPLLFKRNPDEVHADLVKTAKRTQNLPGVRALPRLWAYNNPSLETKVAGVMFRNPVGLSAGFDKTIEMPTTMKNVGFGWMTGGSVTLGVYKGNKRPWFYRLPNTKSIVVNAGLPSEGTPVVAGRVASYNTAFFQDFPLNVSIAKTNSRECATDEAAIQDYCESLAEFDVLPQVRMLEINISCPNTFGGEPFTTPSRLEKLLAAVDDLGLKKPVFIKMPISLPLASFDKLLVVVARHTIAGVCVGNLLKDRKKADLKDTLPADVKGNLSGKPNRQLTTELVRRTYKKYGDKLIIIGIGGVMSAEDAYEKIKAGASLVALVTGLMFEGPQIVGEINHGLARLLRRDGYANIAEAVGVDA